MNESLVAVLDRQRDAWNNGDLDRFMSAYLKSNETSYVSAGTEVWGYEALRDRYVKKYGDKSDTMGKLIFSDLKVFNLGDQHALCIGHWHLERQAQSAVGGTFSLVFTHTASGWKIMHDHTSSN